MATYARPHKRKKIESEGLRGEGDPIKFIDLRFERWQVVGLRELCWGKGHGGLYKAPKKKESRKRRAKSRERSDQVY